MVPVNKISDLTALKPRIILVSYSGLAGMRWYFTVTLETGYAEADYFFIYLDHKNLLS